MSPTYWKRKREKQIARSRLGVLARERKRLAEAEDAQWCGSIIFVGPMFNGGHWMTLKVRGEDRHMLPDIDGNPFRPLTLRGLRGLIAKRIMPSTL
jgi:hypothetical protein